MSALFALRHSSREQLEVSFESTITCWKSCGSYMYNYVSRKFDIPYFTRFHNPATILPAMNYICFCVADIKVLHEREDWRVHNEEGGIVTSLPVLFENRVVDVLLTLKEIVNETYEDTQPDVNRELRDNAKEHFAVLLEVGGAWRGV